MTRLKKYSRRGFAWLLMFALCMGLMQDAAFAAESGYAEAVEEAAAAEEGTAEEGTPAEDMAPAEEGEAAPAEDMTPAEEEEAAPAEDMTPAEEEEAAPAGDMAPTEEAVPTEDMAPAEEAGPTEDMAPTVEAGPEEDRAPAEEAPAQDAASAEEDIPADETVQETAPTKEGVPAEEEEVKENESVKNSESSETTVPTEAAVTEKTAMEAVRAQEAGIMSETDVLQKRGEEDETLADQADKKDETGKDGKEFDLTQTERPNQSETVSVNQGTEKLDETEQRNWEIFYDAKEDVYNLTFHIQENAAGDQTIDLTHALELLGKFAEASRQELEDRRNALEKELEVIEEYQKYKEEYAEYEKAHAEDVEVVKQILTAFGSGYDIAGKTEEELIAEFDKQFGTMFGELSKEPEKPESIREQLEELETLKKPGDLEADVQANVLQPGDIRKFAIYLSSDSKHTYKYKEGSFTLATPDFNLGTDSKDGVLGFDGQVLPDEYVDEAKYHVTLRSEPIQDLLVKELGVDKYDAWNGFPRYVDSQITGYLKEKYGKDTVKENLELYFLDYYSTDEKVYTSITDLLRDSEAARAELTKTATSGNKWFCVNGEKIEVDVHLEDVKYNQFYQNLLSFAYGSAEDIKEVTGDRNFNPGSGLYEYDNNSWTDEGYKNALYYYMAHKEIWEDTDSYFQQLLEKGLTREEATWTSFMMALNIDGELSGNDWQDTRWPWYNSIQLEQMDFDLDLTKTDENGEAITDSETEFQLYYVDSNNEEWYYTYDEESQSYAFKKGEHTEGTENKGGTVKTVAGKLEIAYTLMKDMVYYFREITAPKGYEKDETTYVIMDENKYHEKDAAFKSAYKLLGAIKDFVLKTDFINNKKPEEPEKPEIPEEPKNPEEPETPEEPKNPEEPETPEEPENPEEPETPEEPGTPEEPHVPEELTPEPEEPVPPIPELEVPLTDIPEPEVPLANIPGGNVPLVSIIDQEVPLASVPKTGDASAAGWYAMTILSACCLLVMGMLDKKKNGEENS